MYIIRDVLKAKPGKARALVAIFKNAASIMESLGTKKTRIMTDAVSTYWTVVLEFEVDSIEDYFKLEDKRRKSKELGEIMKGYMDLVTGGHREIFKVE